MLFLAFPANPWRTLRDFFFAGKNAKLKRRKVRGVVNPVKQILR